MALAGVWLVLLALDVTLMWRPLRPYGVGAIVVGFCWSVHVLMLQTAGVMRWQSGIEAETWTAAELRRLRAAGWRLVNHVRTDVGDIDHALVGPGGYLAIETKYRSDWAAAAQDLRDITNRARRDARKLTGHLLLGARARARPVVVAWGGGCEDVFPEPTEIDGVTFVAGRRLRTMVAALPATVSPEQVEAAYHELDRYVQRVEPREIADQGPIPWSVNDATSHGLLLLGAGLAAAEAVLLAIRVPPTGWWSVAVAGAIIATSCAARRRLGPAVRVRHVTTTLISTASGLGLPILAALAGDALL